MRSRISRENAQAKDENPAKPPDHETTPVGDTKARTITVTLGRECFQPLQFNTVEVGPISVTADLLDGETVAAAYMRIRAALTPLFQTEFELKLQDFLERRRQMRATMEKPA